MTANPIIAALDQLAAHAEQIAQLDAREGADSAAISQQIAELVAHLRELDGQVAALAGRVGQNAPDGGNDDSPGHAPVPVPRWWKLSGQGREEAISRLRAWVEQVYRPGYGQLAATLGPCWEQHTLCLYGLDILAELWSVLHLGDERTPAVLAAQAEYQARILPALAEQMMTETTRCSHARTRQPASGYARSTP